MSTESNGSCDEKESDGDYAGVGENHANEPPRKRQRKTPQPFISCHFKILQALHDEDNEVDEDVWDMIERFIAQRKNLAAVRSNAIRMKDIEANASLLVKKYQTQMDEEQKQMEQFMSTKAIMSPFKGKKVGETNNKRTPVYFIDKIIARDLQLGQEDAREKRHPFQTLQDIVKKQIQMQEMSIKDAEQDDASFDGAMVFEESKQKLHFWTLLGEDLNFIMSDE